VKVITDTSLVPNAGRLGVGFVYKDPDSGLEFVHVSVDYLASMARKHRQTNHYPIGANWTQDFIDNVCDNTPGTICHEEAPPSASQKAKNLFNAIVQATRSGFKTITAEQAEARRNDCETSGPGGGHCQHYRGIKGHFRVMCGKCGCTDLKLYLTSSECPKGLWKETQQKMAR